jgi:glucokinase
MSQEPGFVLGIDFGGTKTALATATTAGERLRATRIETRAADGAEEILRRTLVAAHRLAEATGTKIVLSGRMGRSGHDPPIEGQ